MYGTGCEDVNEVGPGEKRMRENEMRRDPCECVRFEGSSCG
jgi:hypothetical protein